MGRWENLRLVQCVNDTQNQQVQQQKGFSSTEGERKEQWSTKPHLRVAEEWHGETRLVGRFAGRVHHLHNNKQKGRGAQRQ